MKTTKMDREEAQAEAEQVLDLGAGGRLTWAEILDAARAAGEDISRGAAEDGHPETAETCWSFWLNDTADDGAPGLGGDQLDPASLDAVKAAFCAGAEGWFRRA